VREAGLPPICILAGGKGIRLGDLAGDVPKPLVSVAGRPFLEHQIELLRSNGANAVVLCVGHMGDRIEAALGDGSRLGVSIVYAYDPPGLAGTAGAVRAALPLLGGEFLVMYGDTYLRVDYGHVVAARRRAGTPALMTVLRNDDRWEPSNVVYARGMVAAYDKRSPPPGARWIDYGLMAMTPEAVDGTGPPDLSDVQRDLAARGLMAGYPVRRRFYDIGTPEALASTDRFLRRRAAGGRT
jgi:NDP-sugar pyrophosphorylase family protein